MSGVIIVCAVFHHKFRIYDNLAHIYKFFDLFANIILSPRLIDIIIIIICNKIIIEKFKNIISHENINMHRIIIVVKTRIISIVQKVSLYDSIIRYLNEIMFFLL